VQAIQDVPSAKAYEARAKTHIQIEKYIEAVDDAGKAIDLDPTLASAYLRKG
jgi:suppressor of G2 allele of SKP1